MVQGMKQEAPSSEAIKPTGRGSSLTQLKTRLIYIEIDKERGVLNRYNSFNILIVLTLYVGILTIFIPEEFATMSLWIFMIHFCFGAFIFAIYNYIR
jgi:hypothetical protein